MLRSDIKNDNLKKFKVEMEKRIISTCFLKKEFLLSKIPEHYGIPDPVKEGYLKGYLQRYMVFLEIKRRIKKCNIT